jgi:hypothetical protein
MDVSIELAPLSTVPPVCPLCGKIGVLPMSLVAHRPEANVTVHYCELCHARKRTEDTLLFSLSMATAVAFASAMGISIAAEREQWTQWLPLWVTLGAVTTLVGFLIGGFRARRLPALAPGSKGQLLLLLNEGPGSRALLAELGATPSSEHPARPSIRRRAGVWLALAPLFGLVLPILVTYSRLRARVVVVDPDADDVLLVDGTNLGRVPSLRHEWPSGGLTVQLIAGSRRLELAGTDGRTRLEERVYLEPGETYVFGELPEQLCLYREEQDHGKSSEHRLTEVRGGPLYQLGNDVQYYFEAPPMSEAAGSHAGLTVSLRLLPCPSRGGGSRMVP